MKNIIKMVVAIIYALGGAAVFALCKRTDYRLVVCDDVRYYDEYMMGYLLQRKSWFGWWKTLLVFTEYDISNYDNRGVEYRHSPQRVNDYILGELGYLPSYIEVEVRDDLSDKFRTWLAKKFIRLARKLDEMNELK